MWSRAGPCWLPPLFHSDLNLWAWTLTRRCSNDRLPGFTLTTASVAAAPTWPSANASFSGGVSYDIRLIIPKRSQWPGGSLGVWRLILGWSVGSAAFPPALTVVCLARMGGRMLLHQHLFSFQSSLQFPTQVAQFDQPLRGRSGVRRSNQAWELF